MLGSIESTVGMVPASSTSTRLRPRAMTRPTTCSMFGWTPQRTRSAHAVSSGQYAAGVTEMNAYWASMAQLVAILLLAFVVEVRAMMRVWSRVPRWLRVTQGSLYLTWLASAAFVLVTAVRGSRPGSDGRSSLAGLAEGTVTGLVILLLTIPILNIVGRAFAEPLAPVLIGEPWIRVKLWMLQAFSRALGWWMPLAAAKRRRRNDRQRLQAATNREAAGERLGQLEARLAHPDLAWADREQLSARASKLTGYIAQMTQYIEESDQRAAETDRLEIDAGDLTQEIDGAITSLKKSLTETRRLVAAQLVSTEDFTDDTPHPPTAPMRRGRGRSAARQPHRNARRRATRSHNSGR